MESLKQVKIDGLKDTKDAPVERVWQTVSGAHIDEYWKPLQPGDQIEGKLSGSHDGNFGKVWLLEVDKRIIGLPSNVVLLNLLLKVPLYSYVRVTFEGMKTGESKKSYKSFKVEVAADGSPFV